MALFVGTSGFNYPAWKGVFYPEKTPATKFLNAYAERLPSVEINYTFRRMPTEKLLAKWSGMTPPEFRFTLKAPQRFTHFEKLASEPETVAYFKNTALTLGPKAGALLFQLPPSFRKDIDRLETFLKMLGPGAQPAFEFRHQSWFSDDTYQCLKDHDAALCVAEDETLAAPMIATAGFGYLRLRKPDYSAADIKKIAGDIRKQSWTDTYVYFKHEDEGRGPKFALQLMKFMGAVG